MSVPWPPPTRYPKHLDTTLQPDHHPQTSCPFSLGVRDKDDSSCALSAQVEILRSNYQMMHRLHGEQVRAGFSSG